MSVCYLLKPLFDQRLAARVMSVKKGTDGMCFGSLEFIEGWPPRQEVQCNVRLHADCGEEIDGQEIIASESKSA
jgi:hypothetical protein